MSWPLFSLRYVDRIPLPGTHRVALCGKHVVKFIGWKFWKWRLRHEWNTFRFEDVRMYVDGRRSELFVENLIGPPDNITEFVRERLKGIVVIKTYDFDPATSIDSQRNYATVEIANAEDAFLFKLRFG